MRKMPFKLGVAAMFVTLMGGVIVGTSAGAGAAATTFRFHGSVSGTLSGSVHVDPPLTLSPSSGPVKVTIKGTVGGLTGNTSEANKGGQTTITGGAFKSVVTLPTGTSCLSLLNGLPAGGGRVKWTSTTTGTGLPAATSTISFGSGSLAGSSPITAVLGGPGTTTKGSFAMPTGGNTTATVVLDQSLNSLVMKCEGAGVSRLTFTGKHGASSMTVG